MRSGGQQQTDGLLRRRASPFKRLACGGGTGLFYVHTDHLDTPRRVSRPADNAIVWRWDADPFGMAPANEDPDGDGGAFTYHLRFPGQYYDAETGLHYNYYRDYDPAIGRYLESDPIGLAGGINSYAYVDGRPTYSVDAVGLDALVITGGIRHGSRNIFGHTANAVSGSGIYSYGNDTSLGSSVAEYIATQSMLCGQITTLVPTTAGQDVQMLKYYAGHGSPDDVGLVDNCAVRTSEALMSAKVPIEGSMFPGGLSREVAGLPGAKSFYVPKGGPILPEVRILLRRFEPVNH